MTDDMKEQILQKMTQTEIARSLGCLPQTISLWFKKGVPPKQVLSFCEATNWNVSPHQVRPDIYPNPNDGLPNDIKYNKLN